MKFELGEIVIMVGEFANGAEAEIIEIAPTSTEGSRQDYRVDIPGFPHRLNNGWCCREYNLRKKHHGDWEDCVWKPEGVTV